MTENSNVNKNKDELNNSLKTALNDGNISLSINLIKEGADGEIGDNKGYTTLMLAVNDESISYENLEMLAGQSGNINKKNIHGETALNNFDGGRKLAVYRRNRHSETALNNSERDRYQKVISLLLRNGADINSENNQGETILMKAVFNNNIKILEALIENGVDVNYRNRDGKTALIYAIHPYSEINMNIFKLLIDAGADLFILDNNRKDICEYLRKVDEYKRDFKEISNFHAELVKEIKTLGNFIKYITTFFGRMVGNVSEKQQLPIKNQKYIMGFLDPSNIIAPGIIEKLENNLTKEGLGKWKAKEHGLMIQELITDKIQIDYRERITQEQKKENENNLSKFS